jgi:hypothetical protein
MKITELDKRHTGNEKYKYFVEPTLRLGNMQLFHTWRSWCWNSFGPGIELRFAIDERAHLSVIPIELPTTWAWQTEFGHTRLYFKDDATLSALIFQWKRD